MALRPHRLGYTLNRVLYTTDSIEYDYLRKFRNRAMHASNCMTLYDTPEKVRKFVIDLMFLFFEAYEQTIEENIEKYGKKDGDQRSSLFSRNFAKLTVDYVSYLYEKYPHFKEKYPEPLTIYGYAQVLQESKRRI